MPNLPSPTVNFNRVEVRGRYVGLDGSIIGGTVTFTPRAARLVDIPALTVIIRRVATAQIDNDGTLSVLLPATDDPDVNVEFTYEVRENFAGGDTYDIEVPIAAEATGIDLASVSRTYPVDKPPGVFVAGTAGPVGQPMTVGRYYSTAPASVSTGIPGEGSLRAAPLKTLRGCTIDTLSCSVTTAGSAGALIRLGVYADDGTGDKPSTTLLADAGTVDASTVGVKNATIPGGLALTAGQTIWLAGVVQGAATTRPTVRQLAGVALPIGDGSASNLLDVTLTGQQASGSVAGSLPTTGFTWGATTSPTRVAAHVSA